MNFEKMSPDEEELTQTQSQTQNTQDFCTQNEKEDVWGRLQAKHPSFTTVDLTNDKFTIGRANTCDYILQEPEVKEKLLLQISKKHCIITRDLSDMSYPTYIQDCSRNGTFVNEERIGMNQRRILTHGDVISVTHAKMRIFIFKDHRRIQNELPAQISEKYHLGKKLGAGAGGTVFLVHNYRTCDSFALKLIKKNELIDMKSDKTLNEAKIMKSLTHPCIVRMFDIFDTPESMYLTLELMLGGELLSRIQQKSYLDEDIAKFYFYQICQAIKYLHDQNITHRDLKPDNILLATSDTYALLKISDFGLSKLVRNNSVLRTLCGTRVYMAPEVLSTEGNGEYTEKVDIWSLGVVLFACLSGTLPFSDDYGTPATEQIKKGRFDFHSEHWKKSTASAKLVVRELLTVDVQQRPSINQLIQHRWLRDHTMLTKAHKVMNIPLERTDVFARPYEVDIDSENVQSSKRRRLR